MLINQFNGVREREDARKHKYVKPVCLRVWKSG